MALVLDGNGTMTVGNGDITGITAGAIEATAIGSGAIRQVVHSSYSTQVSSTSTSYTDTGLQASITPTSASSKILVLISQNSYITTDNGVDVALARNGSVINGFGNYVLFTQFGGVVIGTMSLSYMDSPNSTSSLTYKTVFRTRDSGETVGVNRDSSNVSYITLLEIAQ